MSFRSKASKITAGNYVQIKQEACDKQAQLKKVETTKPSACSPHFGPFQPQNESLFKDLSKSQFQNHKITMKTVNDPPTSSTNTKLLVNPRKSSNGLAKSSIHATLKPSSTTPLNAPTTCSKPTNTKLLDNPPKSTNGLDKSFMHATLKSSITPLNAPTISSKSTNTNSLINHPTTSSNPKTKSFVKPSINPKFKTTNKHESVPCSQLHDDTQVPGESGQTRDAGEKSFNQDKDSRKKDVYAKESGTRLPKGKKRVWKQGGKVQWSEDIVVDPDEVVQVEEIKENESPKLGIMDGTIVAKHVWCLPPGRRIIVHFNDYDQPVRKGGLVLVHFLSDLSKDGSFCPIGAHNWKKVDSHYKKRIIQVVYEKFVLPDRKEIRRMILSHVNIKWRHYKWELQKQYYDPKQTKEELIEKMPENVIEEQWINLVSYWLSEKFKKLSKLGKRARATQDHVHTTGSKSYAQWRIEFVKMNQREPSSLEWWKLTHVTKGGGYVEGTSTQEFMDIAESKVEERLGDSEKTREVIETEIFNELMYNEDKPNQRVVGYGHGVTRTHVYGLEAQIRHSKIAEGGVSSSDIMSIKSYLQSVERKNDEVIARLQRSNDDLEKRNEALESRNELLIKQNEELKSQNVQVLAQLSRVTSFLDKFEQNQKTS